MADGSSDEDVLEGQIMPAHPVGQPHGRGNRLGCEPGEERCDVCCGRPRGTKKRRIVVGNESDVREDGTEEDGEHEGEKFTMIDRKKQRREEDRRDVLAVEVRVQEE